MEKIMDAIRAIRNRRAEMNIPPSKKSKVYVETAFSDVFAVGSEFIKRLAYAPMWRSQTPLVTGATR